MLLLETADYKINNSWPLAISELISGVPTQNLVHLGLNSVGGQPSIERPNLWINLFTLELFAAIRLLLKSHGG